MRRQELILGLATLASVGRASAQDRLRRVGALFAERPVASFLEIPLREKGWILGQNLQIAYRITPLHTLPDHALRGCPHDVRLEQRIEHGVDRCRHAKLAAERDHLAAEP